jgi:hypothetical protein
MIGFAEKYGITDSLHVLESRLLLSTIILCSK